MIILCTALPIACINGGATSEQCKGERGTTIVLQRTQFGIAVDDIPRLVKTTAIGAFKIMPIAGD